LVAGQTVIQAPVRQLIVEVELDLVSQAKDSNNQLHKLNSLS